jgi:hypothetical protein
MAGKIQWVASKNKILENQLVDGQDMSKFHNPAKSRNTLKIYISVWP